jgi:hypothetical protein
MQDAILYQVKVVIVSNSDNQALLLNHTINNVITFVLRKDVQT